MDVVIVGQGYVGLPLAVAAAQAGHRVVGVDTDPRRVESLAAGLSPVGDITDVDLKSVLADGRYRASESVEAVANADVVVLCVPTPYHNDAPDLSFLESAATAVAGHLTPQTLVILESTTYPGTTEDILAPLLEQVSGLKVGTDVLLAFSPERIDPGNPVYGIRNTPKIVGGMTPPATAGAAEFYRTFIDAVVEVSGPKTAEMAKLLENTFRHINIALVNELAILSRELGVDIWEVIDAAASKPFGFMPFYPGPGVGGHCIPVDPMYLSWRVRQFGAAAKFIELARDVNSAMPLYCVARVQEILNDRRLALRGSRVLVVGVTYKRDVADMRESPALPLMRGLVGKGAMVEYHDPYVPHLELDGAELSSTPLTPEAVSAADCVVIVTDHRAVKLEPVLAGSTPVLDTRAALQPGKPNVQRL